jgi:glyoxylase-like metal-dependent hydrolase (beta-lactamase superfamily II)/rhodanese-related sulfurtransferase
MKDKLISVEQLQEKLSNKESVLILDVRPSEQRQEWRIEESTHVDAYEQLKAGDESALDMVDVPANATVVTVCAAGKTSLLASELLRRKGIHAYSLEGGMKTWNYAWNTAELTLPIGVKIIQVRRPAKGVLSYIVGSHNEAVVIDASLDPEVYLKIAGKNGWTIKYALDTHIHADYVSRTGDLVRATGAVHVLNAKAKVEFPFTPVSDGDSIRFGNASIDVIHTPGHTWESATFKINHSVVFTGDTLFVDSVGRPDLKAEEYEAVEKAKSLYQSLKKLLVLYPLTIVLPAHTSTPVPFDSKIIGETIGKVSRNVKVMKLTETQFVEYALSKLPPAPPNYLAIAALNRKGSHEGQQLAELEAGGNHCAIV